MDEPEQATERGVVVKRRWTIVPGRGGRAAILATVGAIALGNAAPAGDPGQSPSQGSDQELATTTLDDEDAGPDG